MEVASGQSRPVMPGAGSGWGGRDGERGSRTVPLPTDPPDGPLRGGQGSGFARWDPSSEEVGDPDRGRGLSQQRRLYRMGEGISGPNRTAVPLQG